MKVSYDFRERTVFLAGAASGIGRAAALACAQAGAAVLASDVDVQGLASLAAASPAIRTLRADIGVPAEAAAAVEAARRLQGRVDAAIITSAIQRRMAIDAMQDALWQQHLDVNLSGVFYLLRALMPIMKAQRSGSILAFTSGLASAGWPGAAAYAATKAGIVGLVKSAAHELRPHGVRINAVSPGLVATPVFLASASREEVDGYDRALGVSQPEEVVPLLMHLISDGASTVSGNVVERRMIPRAVSP